MVGMKPVVLQITVPRPDAEVLTDRLWALGTTGVEEREQGGGTILIAGFPTTSAAEEVATFLRPAYEVELVTVADPASLETWRAYAQPLDVGRQLHVVPAWREASVPSGRITVTIDPGSCFGTGGHPTTQMLLARLETEIGPSTTVLDVGTGSGILAVAAAKLGARRVVAIDIDPEAVPVTVTNAEANGVADRIEVATVPVEEVTGPFDVVLANLSAATLVSLAGSLVDSVAADGVLLASGMLPGQWRHVSAAFGALVPEGIIEREGWIAVPMRRPPRS
ncbi:MAG: ribosomal protein methyltransferase [Acidimicrobiaceae bacterium]|jgi:ribosomal protein L11 methyltransferase|nr:ribosomal protein methyltransferase [Acidimicrobiaceae bacterium]